MVVHKAPAAAVVAVDQRVAGQHLTAVAAVVIVKSEAVTARVHHFGATGDDLAVHHLGAGVAGQEGLEIGGDGGMVPASLRRKGRQQQGILGIKVSDSLGITAGNGIRPTLEKPGDAGVIDHRTFGNRRGECQGGRRRNESDATADQQNRQQRQESCRQRCR